MLKHFYPKTDTLLLVSDWIFITVALIQIVFAEYYSNFMLKCMIKCFPIFTLMYITHQIKKREDISEANYLLAAQLFGAVGDFFLLWHLTPFFLTGMVSFIISHLFYIRLLVKEPVRNQLKQPSEERNIKIGVATIWIIVVINTYMLWDKLPSKIGVISYQVVLASMISLSFTRYKRVCKESFWPVAIGAGLFGISDGLVGFTEFNRIFNPIANVVIMTTYYSSQYLLCFGHLSGIIERKKNKQN